MASRRDQLNAYAYARRRTVAAFLRPPAPGSGPSPAPDAPRPLRAVVPSLLAAGLLLAGFGAWGTVSPGAPPGWDAPGAKVLVGSRSTTRYVVLETDGRPQLHPVLNLASARLLLDPARFGVLRIDESILDDGRIPHGATLGIPYAPDRMPDPADAGTPKLWSVCEQPGGDADAAQKAVFVLAARDAPAVDGAGRLRGDQALYVEGPDGTRYLIGPDGTGFPVAGTGPAAADPAAGSSGGTAGQDAGQEAAPLLDTLFGAGAQPQRVTADWLQTFHRGRPLAFPQIDGVGSPAGVPGLSAPADRIGTVLAVPGSAGERHYVVLKGQIAPVSDLVAALLLNDPAAAPLHPGGAPVPQRVPAAGLAPAATGYLGGTGWPQRTPRPVNTPASTVCSVYRGTMRGTRPDLGVWAGTRYPLPVTGGGVTAYVTPGSGLLYRETGSAAVYLVTDTGLRYRLGVPASPDGTPPATASAAGRRAADEARTRLGYGRVRPVEVPAAWSGLLPDGPALDTADALREQGS